MLRALLLLHIAGGSAALLSMFVPMVAKKGGTLHRRGGWIFVGGMTVVAITAFLLSGTRLLTDPSLGGRQFSAFLFFVGILTAGGVSTGVRVLRVKKRTGAHLHWWDLGWSGLLTLTGVAGFAYGILAPFPFLTAFSIIGLLTGGAQLVYWLRRPRDPMHWWFQHMSSMLGACIAVTTAFLVTAGPRLGLVDGSSLLVWLAPTIVGAPAIVGWNVYYGRKFARGAQRTRIDSSRLAQTSGMI